jgi:hypothetical protein
MPVKLLGVPEFMAALDGMVVAADAASREAVAKGGHLIEAEAKTKLSTYSHAKGTVTPSPAGGPPAIVSGQLRRSIKVTGPTRLGAGSWESRTGPTAVHGRIQELGGATGRGGATYLPPRPYLGPALQHLISSGRLAEVFTQAWRSAWYRG